MKAFKVAMRLLVGLVLQAALQHAAEGQEVRQPPVPIVIGGGAVAPAVVTGAAGDFIYVRVQTDPKLTLQFMVLDQGLKALPAAKLQDKSELVFTTAQRGTYRFLVFYAENRDQPALGIIQVGDPAPGPQPPAPPLPPVPPAPEPEPTDAIWPALKAAWAAEPEATKRADRDALVGVLNAAVVKLDKGTWKTVKELASELQVDRERAVGSRLSNVGAVLNAETTKTVPRTPDAPADPGTRALFSQTFARYAALLRRLL